MTVLIEEQKKIDSQEKDATKAAVFQDDDNSVLSVTDYHLLAASLVLRISGYSILVVHVISILIEDCFPHIFSFKVELL